MLTIASTLQCNFSSSLLILLLVLCIFDYSCVKNNQSSIQPHNTQSAASSQELAVVPSDWPFPWLVPPPGASKALLPYTYRRMASKNPSEYNIARGGSDTDGYYWMLSFSWSGDFAKLVKLMENTLYENNFLQIELKEPSRMANSSLIGFVEYKKKGTSDRVRIVYEKADTSILREAYEIYYFDVSIHK